MLIHLILIRPEQKLKICNQLIQNNDLFLDKNKGVEFVKKIVLFDSLACRWNGGEFVLHDVLPNSHSVPENVVVPGDGAQVEVELFAVSRAQRRQQTDDVVGVARPLVGREISQTLHRGVHFFLQLYKSAGDKKLIFDFFFIIFFATKKRII